MLAAGIDETGLDGGVGRGGGVVGIAPAVGCAAGAAAGGTGATWGFGAAGSAAEAEVALVAPPAIRIISKILQPTTILVIITCTDNEKLRTGLYSCPIAYAQLSNDSAAWSFNWD